MKKLGFLLLGGLLFCCNANADLICVKKKVTVKNQLPLSQKFKVVNAEKCPKGFQALINTINFAGPQGERGETGDRGEKGDKGDNYYDETSIPSGVTVTGLVGGTGSAYAALSLPAPYEINPASIGSAAECKGTKFEPSAPLGKVCIYKISGDNDVFAEAISLEDYELNNQEDCESIGYQWTPASCDHQEYTTQEECTKNKGEWKADGLCLDGDNIVNMNEGDCQTAGNHWVAGNCSNDQYTIQSECITNGGTWTTGACTDLTSTEQALCEIPRGRWNNGFCEEATASRGYSKHGFLVRTTGNEPFSAIWAYTAPEMFVQ